MHVHTRNMIECTPFERTGPPQNGIQSTQQQQAAASVINSGANMQQPSASQQPIQFQNIVGPGQVSFNENPPPPYYGGYPYPNQGYFQDPTKMAYATLPMQPYQHLLCHPNFTVEIILQHHNRYEQSPLYMLAV